MGYSHQEQQSQKTDRLNSVRKKPSSTIVSLQPDGYVMKRYVGNQALQAKLTIGAPNDKYEQEADRVADQVMRMPDSDSHHEDIQASSLPDTAISRLQRQTDEEEEESLQMKRSSIAILQRQTEEEEEELAQPKRAHHTAASLLQRQVEEEEEESLQAKSVATSQQSLQRQVDEEEEEALQPKRMEQGRVQRQIEEEEEELQPKRIDQTKVQRQTEEEEEETLQSKASSTQATAVGASLSNQIQQLRSSGSELNAQSKSFFEPRFGRDFSAVRVHTDQRAADTASAANARAFTVGHDIVFGAGQFQPHNEQGKHLLAHELTHVVQQNPGAVQRKPLHPISPLGEKRIQTRRIPPAAEVSAEISGASRSAHRSGLAVLVERAMAQLSATRQAAVRTRARGTMSAALFNALPTWQQNQRLAAAIYDLDPTMLRRLRHGDPSLYMTGPRPATADTANINTLVGNANTQFAAVAAGTYDTWIDQVFGAANRNTAKGRYARARSRMNTLHGMSNRIVSDRSGYSREVGLGGLTNANRIMLSPRAIDNPGAHSSIAAMVHESMHAGNPGVVGDRGYISTATIFTRMSEPDKLANAAHYEVPIWRALNNAHPYAYHLQTFTPAGTGATPPMTATQRGVRMATELFRKAWTAGLWLHGMYIDVHERPARWTPLLAPRYSGAHANARYRNTLPYWTKVAKMTTYRRIPTISHTSADASRRPITRIDVALSEGVVRKFNLGMRNMPRTQTAAQTFITANATPLQRTYAAGNANRIRNLLLRLVLRRHVGRITGGIVRDLAVVRRFAWAYGGGYSRVLRPRSAHAFPHP